jgi:hypothetical protein
MVLFLLYQWSSHLLHMFTIPATPLFFCVQQLLFAFSPLLALGFILFSAFETKDEEDSKRKKKDFDLAGHGE